MAKRLFIHSGAGALFRSQFLAATALHKIVYFGAIMGLSCSLLLLVGCTQTTEIDGGVSQKQGPYVQVKHTIKWDPPGSYLASFDATKALLNLSLSNATISSTSGTVTVTVTDLTTSQAVGQQTFGYTVSGNSVYAQDPTAVFNWLQQFTSYSNIEVSTDITATFQTTAAGPASDAASAQYQGVAYGSTTVSWDYNPGTGDGGCHTKVCPNQ